jgi:hypothetical protein
MRAVIVAALFAVFLHGCASTTTGVPPCPASLASATGPCLYDPTAKAQAPAGPVKEFRRSDSASRELRGKAVPYSFWVDDSWQSVEPSNPLEQEFELRHADRSRFALVIPTRFRVPPTALRKRLEDNLRARDREARVTYEERRLVNGAEIVYVNANLTVEQIPMAMAAYLWSGTKGSVQVIVVVPRDDFPSLRPESEEFLNGFVAPAP